MSLACAAGNDLFEAVALLLKQQFERQTGVAGQPAPQEAGQSPEIPRAGPPPAEGGKFRPDVDEIYAALLMHRELLHRYGYERRSVETLCRAIVLADLHLVAGDSVELAAFCACERKVSEGLAGDADEMLRERHHAEKAHWIQLQESLGEVLLELEDVRNERAEITQRWLQEFGACSVELEEQALRVEELDLRQKLMAADPSLSREELEAAVASACSAKRRRLRELELSRAHAAFSLRGLFGIPPGDHEYAGRRQEARKLLRQLFSLLHPDKLQHHPASGKLTEKQLAMLREMWGDLMALKPKDMSHPRRLAELRDVLSRVEATLDKAGIDTDPDLVIRGDSVEEQLTWLSRASDRLLRAIADVQAEIKGLLDDPEINGKANLLGAAPDVQEAAKADMRARARKLRERGDALEATLESHFAVVH